MFFKVGLFFLWFCFFPLMLFIAYVYTCNSNCVLHLWWHLIIGNPVWAKFEDLSLKSCFTFAWLGPQRAQQPRTNFYQGMGLLLQILLGLCLLCLGTKQVSSLSSALAVVCPLIEGAALQRWRLSVGIRGGSGPTSTTQAPVPQDMTTPPTPQGWLLLKDLLPLGLWTLAISYLPSKLSYAL